MNVQLQTAGQDAQGREGCHVYRGDRKKRGKMPRLQGGLQGGEEN